LATRKSIYKSNCWNLYDVTDCNIIDGTITVTGIGGTGIYEYSLNGGAYQSSNSFTGLMVGTHVVLIRDANNCISECEATLIAPEVPMCNIGDVVNIACKGAATGSFMVNATGGSGVYEYSLDNTSYQSATSFTGLTAGMYTVYVRNTTSPMCVSMCSVNITEPEQLACNLMGTPISCFEGTDGTITVNATGGVMPFEYSLDGGAWQSSPAYSNLPIGTYAIRVRDANACISDCTITLIEPLCNGGTGTITVTGIGGVTPYEYSINGSPWQPGNIFTSLVAGTYTTSIRDANNCLNTCEIIITEPSVLSCTLSKTDLTDCNIIDGTITVIGTGGTGSYEYSLDGSAYQTSNSFTGLMAGAHVVTIRDGNNCISQCEAILTAPEAPMCTINNVINIACMGAATGSFTVVGGLC